MDGVYPIVYVKSLLASNSFAIIAPRCCNVKKNIIKTQVSFINLGDPYRIRTDVNGVRGRCLNHLTNGPLVQLQGLEPGTH